MIDALHRLIPSSKKLVSSVSTITADNILKSLDTQGINFDVHRLTSGDWDIEGAELTDSEILSKLRIEDADHSGMLLISTEACSRYNKQPFSCKSSEIEDFVEKYEIEMFFDGDVIMISEESRTLTIFHHEGAYVHVRIS